MLEVSNDFDPETDFAVFKTYDLMPKADVALSADAEAAFGERKRILEEEFRNALKREMEAKGFTRDTSNPDIMIAYYIGVRDEVFVSNYGMTYADLTGNYMKESLSDGAVRIDFVDPKKERLVWSGTAFTAVNRDPTEDMIRKNVDRAVKKMLDQYPPKKTTESY